MNNEESQSHTKLMLLLTVVTTPAITVLSIMMTGLVIETLTFEKFIVGILAIVILAIVPGYLCYNIIKKAIKADSIPPSDVTRETIDINDVK